MSDKAGLQIEIWECRACGTEVPCRIEITFSPISLLGVERFRRKECFCKEREPAWSRLPDRKAR